MKQNHENRKTTTHQQQQQQQQSWWEYCCTNNNNNEVVTDTDDHHNDKKSNKNNPKRKITASSRTTTIITKSDMNTKCHNNNMNDNKQMSLNQHYHHHDVLASCNNHNTKRKISSRSIKNSNNKTIIMKYDDKKWYDETNDNNNQMNYQHHHHDVLAMDSLLVVCDNNNNNDDDTSQHQQQPQQQKKKLLVVVEERISSNNNGRDKKKKLSSKENSQQIIIKGVVHKNTKQQQQQQQNNKFHQKTTLLMNQNTSNNDYNTFDVDDDSTVIEDIAVRMIYDNMKKHDNNNNHIVIDTLAMMISHHNNTPSTNNSSNSTRTSIDDEIIPYNDDNDNDNNINNHFRIGNKEVKMNNNNNKRDHNNIRLKRRRINDNSINHCYNYHNEMKLNHQQYNDNNDDSKQQQYLFQNINNNKNNHYNRNIVPIVVDVDFNNNIKNMNRIVIESSSSSLENITCNRLGDNNITNDEMMNIKKQSNHFMMNHYQQQQPMKRKRRKSIGKKTRNNRKQQQQQKQKQHDQEIIIDNNNNNKENSYNECLLGQKTKHHYNYNNNQNNPIQLMKQQQHQQSNTIKSSSSSCHNMLSDMNSCTILKESNHNHNKNIIKNIQQISVNNNNNNSDCIAKTHAKKKCTEKDIIIPSRSNNRRQSNKEVNTTNAIHNNKNHDRNHNNNNNKRLKSSPGVLCCDFNSIAEIRNEADSFLRRCTKQSSSPPNDIELLLTSTDNNNIQQQVSAVDLVDYSSYHHHHHEKESNHLRNVTCDNYNDNDVAIIQNTDHNIRNTRIVTTTVSRCQQQISQVMNITTKKSIHEDVIETNSNKDFKNTSTTSTIDDFISVTIPEETILTEVLRLSKAPLNVSPLSCYFSCTEDDDDDNNNLMKSSSHDVSMVSSVMKSIILCRPYSSRNNNKESRKSILPSPYNQLLKDEIFSPEMTIPFNNMNDDTRFTTETVISTNRYSPFPCSYRNEAQKSNSDFKEPMVCLNDHTTEQRYLQVMTDFPNNSDKKNSPRMCQPSAHNDNKKCNLDNTNQSIHVTNEASITKNVPEDENLQNPAIDNDEDNHELTVWICETEQLLVSESLVNSQLKNENECSENSLRRSGRAKKETNRYGYIKDVSNKLDRDPEQMKQKAVSSKNIISCNKEETSSKQQKPSSFQLKCKRERICKNDSKVLEISFPLDSNLNFNDCVLYHPSYAIDSKVQNIDSKSTTAWNKNIILEEFDGFDYPICFTDPYRRGIRMEEAGVHGIEYENEQNMQSFCCPKFVEHIDIQSENESPKQNIQQYEHFVEAVCEPTSEIEIIHGWTEKQLCQLRNARECVNPTSNTFWSDVAGKVDGKFASECRDQWYAQVITPAVRHKRKALKASPNDTMEIEDDDIFNSTPMRALLSIDDGIQLSCKDLSPIQLADDASTIHDENRRLSSSTFEDEEDCGYAYIPKVGFKSYISGMRRNIVKARKQKPLKKVQRKTNRPVRMHHTMKETFDNGNIHLNAILSPGGRLEIKNKSEYDDIDNYWSENTDDEDNQS